MQFWGGNSTCKRSDRESRLTVADCISDRVHRVVLWPTPLRLRYPVLSLPLEFPFVLFRRDFTQPQKKHAARVADINIGPLTRITHNEVAAAINTQRRSPRRSKWQARFTAKSSRRGWGFIFQAASYSYCLAICRHYIGIFCLLSYSIRRKFCV